MSGTENTSPTTATREPSGAEDSTPGIHPPGFRLPAGTRLGRVRLQVADLERSSAYYREVLGFRELERSGDRAVFGDAEGAPLVELREKRGVAPVPRHGRIGLYHFAILLPDRASLGRLVAHLTARGIRFGASDHLVSEAIYLTDPDGLGIEVYTDRPRSGWRYGRGELEMDTRPLDLQEVVRAAGDESWTGMPAGTVIGHVHLHVGEIDRAESFYHEGLGFDKVVWSYPGALFLSAGGYHHHLGVNTWAAGAPPAGEDDARLLDWEILLPDQDWVAATAKSLTEHGEDLRMVETGEVIARDPWGTALRLSRP